MPTWRLPEQITQHQQALTASLSAQAVFVVDVDSAAPLLAKDPVTPHYPASTTKLMTALVAYRTFPLTKMITITDAAESQGTVIGLLPSEQVTVQSLLTGLLIQSGNDAAFALGSAYPFGYPGFVTAMNQTAGELGMLNSHYTNPSGLDEEGQYMSARDLSVLVRAIIQQPLLKQFITTQRTSVRGQLLADKREVTHQLLNTHALLGRDPRVRGGKTGTTPEAGEVLVTLAQIANHEVVIVVMGSQDRYGETKQILNWLEANVIWLVPPKLATLQGSAP